MKRYAGVKSFIAIRSANSVNFASNLLYDSAVSSEDESSLDGGEVGGDEELDEEDEVEVEVRRVTTGSRSVLPIESNGFFVFVSNGHGSSPTKLQLRLEHEDVVDGRDELELDEVDDIIVLLGSSGVSGGSFPSDFSSLD